ncbi:MAG: VOC family protein [Chlorobi bacterium]|nr:VOC family protein [Chlorobiota bacterium]
MSRIVHFEIMADKPDDLLSFYNNVFGWESHKWDGPMDYWLVKTGEEGVGINGGVARKQEGFPSVVNIIDVDSVDDFVAKIESAGGTIIIPKMPIPGVGWTAYANDPEGNMFGIMQADASVS